MDGKIHYFSKLAFLDNLSLLHLQGESLVLPVVADLYLDYSVVDDETVIRLKFLSRFLVCDSLPVDV